MQGISESAADIAAELVRLKVDVIVSSATAPTLAAKRATSDIPIVFTAAGDPVGSGLIASLAQPGGNITGLSLQFTDLAGKRLALLREVLPGLRRFGILASVGSPSAVLEIHEVQATAQTLGLEVFTPDVRRSDDIAPAIETLKDRVEALYVIAEPLMNTNRVLINARALVARMPTMHGARELVEAGGLMSYGPSFTDLYRRAAGIVDKILRGAKAADIPVEQPTKFDFIINLATAKALDLVVLPSLLARADEVIE
jgi:putative ABC transport system substrate-binding protein